MKLFIRRFWTAENTANEGSDKIQARMVAELRVRSVNRLVNVFFGDLEPFT